MPIKNSQQNPEVKILVRARPRGETFAKAAHRKSANVEDLEVFLKVANSVWEHPCLLWPRGVIA